jgi:hypothetical protein
MNARVLATFLVLNFLLPAARAHAQCASWVPGPLDNGLDPNGANNTIYAAISWDPDDTGPLAPRLVVGGTFTSIENVAALHIAQRDPATGLWSPVGTGLNMNVYSLAIYNGQLVAGGDGDNNVGTFDQTVRRWDGSAWQNFAATNTGDVLVMEVYNGSLYIGGTFMTHFVPQTSNDAFFIARWNPVANLWDAVDLAGFGSQTNTAVSALAVYGGDLYVGGWIKNASSPSGSVLRISHGNAGGWAAITNGTDVGGINDFGVFGGELIVAGGYNTINGVAINNIAGWNGSSFHAFSTGTAGSPFGGGVYSVTVHNGIVIAGVFITASGLTTNHVAFWPPGGSSWQPMGGGTDNSVLDVVSYGGELVAVGGFTVAERTANYIAHWDGYQWGSFGGGTGNYVLAMATFNGRVVAGGDFHQSTPSLSSAHNIASWNGGAARVFGVGMNGSVMALKAFKYPGINGSNELIAGGVFSRAGGIAVNNITRWNESFIVFPPSAWAAMGSGFNNAVYAIERYNNITYAGGAFTASGATGLNRIAKWNETTDVWEPMSSGMNGFVYAMKVYNGNLYVGGNFTTAGGVVTGGLARWNGSAWSSLGGPSLGGVLSLEVYNNLLVIGGQFSGISGSPNLIVYDGVNFSTLGTGGANNNVRALKAFGTRLYAGGDFTSIGGVAANRIAYWDGTWHDLHYGTDNIVFALGSYTNEIHVGGSFQNVDFGGPIRATGSPFWGRYDETGLPWFSANPSSVTAQLGDNVSFTAQLATGFLASFQWYHNDLPLSNGPTGNGSTIGGATALSLSITSAVWTDHGSYRVEATNSCGSTSSFAATLDFTGVTAAPSPGTVGTTVFEALGPNPSGGATQLAFSLASDAAVRVRIYDLAGRLVRHVDLGRLPAGRHLASWDARDNHGRKVAGGSYFVGVDVDGRSIGAKRLTVLH